MMKDGGAPQPCEDCGTEDAQMHHEDYGRPQQYRWLCEDCGEDCYSAHGTEPSHVTLAALAEKYG